MSAIGLLADPTWLGTYAAGNLGYVDLASSTVAEETTLSALLAPQPQLGSPFFPAPATLDPATSASATSSLATAEASDPTLAGQMEQLSNEGSLLDVLA